MNKDYFEVEIISTQPESLQSLQALCMNEDCLGIVETENGFLAYFSKDHKDEILHALPVWKKQFSFQSQCSDFESKNWNEEWEKDYKAIRVGNFCGVYAPFHIPENDVKHQLIINPQMAFGTGHHETTFLMIEQLEKLDLQDKTVLDLGSGTGILAIVAAKEGAKEITAIDIDENAYIIMKQNFVENECDTIQARLGGAEQIEEKADIILANINRNVLLEESKTIVEHLNQKGYVVLSGFFTTDCSKIRDCYQQLGLQFISVKEKNNWASLIFKN